MDQGFWNIPDIKDIRTPASIFKEQGTALSDATKGLLYGVVNSVPGTENMYIRMDIIVPALNNYVYNILEYWHPILTLYPGKMSSKILKRTIDIISEEDLLASLQALLGSEDVKRILEGLMLQAGSASK